MAGQRTAILATDYNLIQSKVALVLGSGTGNIGYGQLVESSQVTSRTNVTIAQWNSLRTDLLKARQHQTGTDLSSVLNVASRTVNITEADRAAYDAIATAINNPTNRLVTPPPTEGTRENLVPVQQIGTPWNGSLTQTVTVTFLPGTGFTGDDAARYFFNTGSQIEFSASRSLGTPGIKNNTWTAMFTGMGTIYFGHDSTSCSGSGEPAATIGYYQLTTDDKVIFEKNAPSGSYSNNKYFILARKGNTGSTQVIFTITMQDITGGDIDENVDGLLTSTVQTYYATGSNVSVPKPPASTSALL